MNRVYTDYIEDILKSIKEIEEFTKNVDPKQFKKDSKTVNAVIRSLEVLGEASKKIPDKIRNKYPEIPWKKMAGMRDKLIHEYHGVDLDIIWNVVKGDLPPIKPHIENMLKDYKT